MQSGNEIWPVYAILQNNFFVDLHKFLIDLLLHI